VHDPVGLGAPGRAALVEDERLLDADALAGGAVVDGLVGAGGLPVAGPRRAVGADAVGVLAVARAEEVVLAVAVHSLGGELPWVQLVDVDVGDDGDGARQRGRAVAEVVQDELLVGGVEPEPRRQLRRRRRRGHHLQLQLQLRIVDRSASISKLAADRWINIYKWRDGSRTTSIYTIRWNRRIED